MLSMMFTPSASVRSRGVDENEFSILFSHDGEFGLVDGGDAVPDRNPAPVYDDHALGWGEIGVAIPIRRVVDLGPREQRRAHDTRVSAYEQRLCVFWLSARQLNKTSCPIRFRKLAAVPARRRASLPRKQPDLKEL